MGDTRADESAAKVTGYRIKVTDRNGMEFRCKAPCNFASHADSEQDGFRDECHLQVAPLETRPIF